MKVRWDSVHWGQSEITKGSDHYFYYIYFVPSWYGWQRDPEMPRVGIFRHWYDGPHVGFRVGPLIWTWSLPNSRAPDEMEERWAAERNQQSSAQEAD